MTVHDTRIDARKHTPRDDEEAVRPGPEMCRRSVEGDQAVGGARGSLRSERPMLRGAGTTAKTRCEVRVSSPVVAGIAARRAAVWEARQSAHDSIEIEMLVWEQNPACSWVGLGSS